MSRILYGILLDGIINLMKNNLEQIEEKVKKKAKIRENKKKPKMKVSGKSVFKLRERMRKK